MTDDSLKEILISELEKAENIWNDVKDDLLEKSDRSYSITLENYTPSNIPGFPLLKNGQGKVGQFIALVLDTRNSSDHLLVAINNKKGVSQLQRVLYENTAINTIGLILVNENKGRITEFLGDGFLSIFSADNKETVYKAKKVAEEFLRLLKTMINPLLKERYDLPELSVGIGIAYSKAIVTTIGIENYLFPKAIGECIYRATKLSNGFNEILYDETIKLFWPSSSGGKLIFKEKTHKNTANGVKGYITIKKNE